MAVTIEFGFPSGLSTVTGELYPDGSDTIANGAGGDSATEYTNRKGWWSMSVAESITGFHLLVLKTGGTPIDRQWVNIEATTGTFKAKKLAVMEEVVDLYHADIDVVFDDDGAGSDQYTIGWFKNGVPITSGITSPTIQVVKQFDGSDLIASNSMTQIGTTGVYKYTASGAERVTSGDATVVIATATIDGASRTFRENNGRDLTV